MHCPVCQGECKPNQSTKKGQWWSCLVKSCTVSQFLVVRVPTEAVA